MSAQSADVRFAAGGGLSVLTLVVVLAAGVGVCVLGLFGRSADASLPPEDGEQDGIVLTDELLEAPVEMPSRALWAWPEGRRGFALDDYSAGGFGEVVAYDLDGLDEVARVSPPVNVWGASEPNIAYGHGQPNLGAVDRDGGRLVLPYGFSMDVFRTSRDLQDVISPPTETPRRGGSRRVSPRRPRRIPRGAWAGCSCSRVRRWRQRA